MTTTTANARDEILAILTPVIASFPGIVVQYPGVDNLDPPGGDKDWMRVVMEHDNGRQGSLAGADGPRRWNRTGSVFIQCFGLLAKGSVTKANDMACAVRDAFQGRATVSGVWFRNCGIREVGPDKFWYQTNAYTTFEYDEVK